MDEPKNTRVLITGASGNLGTLLARHIRDNEKDLRLVLMQHKKAVASDLATRSTIRVIPADLNKPETLSACLDGVDVIVHFAGVLFKSDPEKFLPVTNVHYFNNLLAAALQCGIKKVILVSFPHVEGPTSRERPANGRLDGHPISVHAITRLEEEKQLFEKISNPISLRVGMVYGRGILMVEAARWLAKRRLLGVWKKPTQIHLISKIDFCRAAVAAITNGHATGIYQIGDEGNDTLQTFLDFACDIWGCKRPWKMPLGWIYLAARLSEVVSKILKTASPLTRDFIDIGRIDYYGDTTRFRLELLPVLKYRTVYDGVAEMKG